MTTWRSRIRLYSTGRRGVAGTLVVEKIVGAAAEKGIDLEGCADARRAGQRAHPLDGRGADKLHRAGRGKPTFALGEDEMEMGVGIHGEPGRRRVKLATADAIAEEMVGAIVGDLDAPQGGERVCCSSTASAARR